MKKKENSEIAEKASEEGKKIKKNLQKL